MIKEPYTYKNGCTLEMLDYGEEGVLIRMTDPDADVVSAVLLPPEVLNDAVDWFSEALAFDRVKMPPGLKKLLNRMLKVKKKFTYKRGDLTIIKETVTALVKIEKQEKK